MKLSFHGAARTVTGSKHLITLSSGSQVLLDCGLFQGMGSQTAALNEAFGFEPADVDHVILSHAHIDHSGLLPRLVQKGFRGKIFCTPATKELASILLIDSAEIQRDDARFSNKRRAKQGLPPVAPLYSVDDARQAVELFETVAYGEQREVLPGVQLLFTDAGHIVGSAAVHLIVDDKGKKTRLTFSGDVGRYNDALLRSPEAFPQADYIIMESTYGTSVHQDVFNTIDRLEEWITKTCVSKKGKLIIPAFSVGRTQELLYFLNQLSLENRLPAIPVYVDSPLSLEATHVVKNHMENFNRTIQNLLKIDNDPFDFPGLKFIQSVDESKALNEHHQPMIIISSSGMADAGRIKHHILNNIGESKNTILLVGYCEPRSLGGKLAAGAKEVKIFSEHYEVIAEVGSLRSMSAHGDYDDLCQFLAGQDTRAVKQLFIVHGEENVQLAFKERLHKKGYINIAVPSLHESFYL